MPELIPLLNVEDVRASVAFYTTVLPGASLAGQWEDEGRLRWAHLTFDGGSLMLNEPDTVSSSERRQRADFADVVLYLGCDDAHARREELAAAGIEAGAVSSETYGQDEFSVRDPDGYSLRIASSANADS